MPSIARLPKFVLTVIACASVLSAPATRAADRPPIVGVAHIAFLVSDLAKARAFYGELLGYSEPFQIFKANGSLLLTFFKVNERQYIEIFPGLPLEQEDRLFHIALETTDLEALRSYLESKGVKVPAKVNQSPDGNLMISITDPDGHGVEFVQYRPDSIHAKAKGRYLSDQRISDRILHVGITVTDVAAADRFYKDILGFSEIWRGGATDTTTNWINMKVPDGTDYIEYMLIQGKVDRQRLGVLHHVALQVPDIQKALDTIRQRSTSGNPATIKSPQIGRNQRWQLNLYDPDGSRAELMEPFIVR
jgi:lactoylglutathione lyase